MGLRVHGRGSRVQDPDKRPPSLPPLVFAATNIELVGTDAVAVSLGRRDDMRRLRGLKRRSN